MITITCWVGRKIWIAAKHGAIAKVQVKAIPGSDRVRLEFDALPGIPVLRKEQALKIIEERAFVPFPPAAA